jgi:hypothetical protein
MNKTVRIILAGLLLLGIVFLARNGIASAGAGMAEPKAQAVQSRPQSGGLFTDIEPGSVKPPPVVVPPVTGPGTYSVGGVCTVQVAQLASSVTLHAVLVPFSTLGKHPQDVGRYLAGVCQLNYTKAGAGITDLAPADGSVTVCFAALPNTTTKIYVFDGKTWTALTTTLNNGLECAAASKTGRYVLAAG